MKYLINPAAFSTVFTVPAEVADRHLRLARGEYLKVLLYVMRNMADGINPESISEATGLDGYTVEEALLYWSQEGILATDQKPMKEAKNPQPAAPVHTEKPSRYDVARRGAEDEKIRYMLSETQMRLGRNLKSNEASTLVWLYDDLGIEISLILMIVQYAAAHKRANIRFIESTATDWLNRGITTITDADAELNRMAMGEQAWGVVCSAFGLERRKPSPKELSLSLLWVNEWKITPELLTAAYNACVDEKSRFYMPYTAKIIESWHKKGYKTPEDIEKKKNAAAEKSFAAYDIDLFEKMLNSDGE